MHDSRPTDNTSKCSNSPTNAVRNSGRPRWSWAEACGQPQVCKKLRVSEQTYYPWREEYGGLPLDHAKRLKALEQENLRLKKLVADQRCRFA